MGQPTVWIQTVWIRLYCNIISMVKPVHSPAKKSLVVSKIHHDMYIYTQVMFPLVH